MQIVMIKLRVKFWIFGNYWWVVPTVAVVFVSVVYLADGNPDKNTLVTVGGGFLTAFYFLHQQRIEEIKLFREIFSECNLRYDKMNENINAIVSKGENEALSEKEKNQLSDYFNLCGEEYLYFKQGFIYPDVWLAWSHGMKVILKNPRVAPYWQIEKKSDSYYGVDNEVA
jgi:hypothetical protein